MGANEILESLSDITTVEVAQKVMDAHGKCDCKSCYDCYLDGDYSCSAALKKAKDIIDRKGKKEEENPEPAIPSIKWIDERYMQKDSPAKEIRTVKEAMAIIFEHNKCKEIETCEECGIYMYERNKCCDCYEVIDDANDFLKSKLELGNKGRISGSDIYSFLTSLPASVPEPSKETERKTSVAVDSPSCDTCDKYNPVGGVPFCNAWHNYTSPEGHCHLFSPVDKS